MWKTKKRMQVLDWKEYRLDKVADVVGGGTPSTTIKEYWNGEIPWITPRDLSGYKRKTISKGERCISELGLRNSNAKLLPKGTVLLSSRAPIGYLVIAENKVSTNQGFQSLIPNEKTSTEFLFYLLKSNVDYLISQGTGTTFSELSKSVLKELVFKFPSLPEQQQIASILSSLDDKIDLLHRQNKTLEQLAETLFRQWFIEEAEESWEEVLLGDYIKVKHGFAFKGNYISTEPTNLILVTPGNFKIGGGFKSDKFKYYTSEEFPSDYIFQDGDLSVTMTDLSIKGDTLGYPALIPQRTENELYLHNQRVGKIEIKKEISKFFIYFLMKTKDYQWFILSGASGTSIRHTSPTSICSYSFSLPPKQRLLDFEHYSNDLFKKIESNANQIRTLTQLRDTLLPKLMSGEVRVV